MTTYNHLFAIAFSVISEHESADDVTVPELRRGIGRRLMALDREGTDAWKEAVLNENDSFEQPDLFDQEVAQ